MVYARLNEMTDKLIEKIEKFMFNSWTQWCSEIIQDGSWKISSIILQKYFPFYYKQTCMKIKETLILTVKP